jgi:hypothetical protein
MHRESAGEGAGLPRTGLTRDGGPRGDLELGPHGGASAGTRGEAGRAGVRAARAGRGGASAEYREALRRADALIADTRALLARLEAEAFRPDPARPPRLRLVGGVEWSGGAGGAGRGEPTHREEGQAVIRGFGDGGRGGAE